MSNDNHDAENLELQKVLAASLAFTQKEFRRAKRELIEEFKGEGYKCDDWEDDE